MTRHTDCPPAQGTTEQQLIDDLPGFALGLVDMGRDAVLDCRTDAVTDLVGRLPASQLRRLVQALALLAGGLAARSPNRDWWTPARAGTEGVTSHGDR